MYVKDEDFYWVGFQSTRNHPDHYTYFPTWEKMWDPDYIAFYGGEYKFISRRCSR